MLVLRPLLSDGNLITEFSRQWTARDIPLLPKSSLYSDAVLLFCYALHELLLDNVPFKQVQGIGVSRLWENALQDIIGA
jgi:hypothetical protein